MTLTNAIEAAREAFQACVPHIEQSLFCIEQTIKYGVCGNCGCVDQPAMTISNSGKGCISVIFIKQRQRLKGVLSCCKNNLAALPDKPMTEEEIKALMQDAYGYHRDMDDVFRALKAANVLYVEEK